MWELVDLIFIVFFLIYSILRYYFTILPADKHEPHILYRFTIRETGPGDENVHDGNVRGGLWLKYNIIMDEMTKTPGFSLPAMLASAQRMPEVLKPLATPKQYGLLKKLTAEVFTSNATINDDRGNAHYEKNIFAFSYCYFCKLGLDKTVMLTQYLDCFDEDGTSLCFIGKISRFILMFEGLVAGPLGESRETKHIAFQRALHEAKLILDKSLGENNEIKTLYNSAELSHDDEKKLSDYLEITKKQIQRHLRNNFNCSKIDVEKILKAIE